MREWGFYLKYGLPLSIWSALAEAGIFTDDLIQDETGYWVCFSKSEY
jgi:hypothetical protein